MCRSNTEHEAISSWSYITLKMTIDDKRYHVSCFTKCIDKYVKCQYKGQD